MKIISAFDWNPFNSSAHGFRVFPFHLVYCLYLLLRTGKFYKVFNLSANKKLNMMPSKR